MMNTQDSTTKIINATDDSFQQDVIESDLPVLVDFWAPWCGPCKAVAPILEELVANNPSVRVVKVNVDENAEMAKRYNVRAIPTLLLFKNGEVQKTQVGAVRKPELEAMLTS